MAGTLLIIGMTLFLVGTLVLAQDASSRSRNWLVVVLPFTGMGYCRDYWVDVRLAILLRVLGGFMLLFGIGVLIAQNPQLLSQNMLASVGGSSTELKGSKLANVDSYANAATDMLIERRSEQQAGLVGELGGRSFRADRAQLSQGVLSLQQGEDFIPEQEIRIIVGLDASWITSRQEIFVRPGDASVPEVQISVLPDGEAYPETRVVKAGYSLELQLAPVDENQLKGFIQLVIPGPVSEYLVGEFVAYTNNLHYRDGRVDLTYDDPDTLEYVAHQYVSVQYPAGLLEKVEYRDTSMQLSRDSGTTVARVYLSNGQIEDKFLELERADIGWALSPGGVRTEIIQLGAMTTAPTDQTATENTELAVEPPLETTFADLAKLTGSQLVIKELNGESRNGKILDVRRNLLRIESIVGSGAVQFSIAREEIASLRFASGRKIVLLDGEQAATAVTSTPTDQPSQPAVSQPAPAPEVSHRVGANSAMQPYTQYVGKTVSLTDATGKTRIGQVLGVSDRELRLSVRLGSGTLEYFYSAADIASIKEVSP